jgi:protein phosphatase
VAFRAAGLKDVGRKRKANQDWFDITDIEHPNGAYHLLILADGMGGGIKGDVASQTAVEAVVQYFRTARWYNPEEACREAAFSANRAVWEKGTGGGQATKSFMGTTLVFALVESVTNRAWLANVGDSRAYLLRQGAFEQATRDHSVVADFSHEGPPLSPEEIARLRNVVTRAIGLEATVAPDIFGPFELEPGDRILLSSDGLHGVVRDDRIQRLAGNTDMERALRSLVAAANGAGGPDNISVVMGGREGGVAAGGGGGGGIEGRLVVAGLGLAAVGVVALIAAVASDLDWMPSGSQPETPTPSFATARGTESPSVATTTPPPATPTSGLPAPQTDRFTVPSLFDCDTAFDALMIQPGLAGLSARDEGVMRRAFYKVIDLSAPDRRTCPVGLWVGDEIDLPNAEWFKSNVPTSRGQQ